MRVDSFEGLPNAQIIELFCAACAKEYAEIDSQAAAIEANMRQMTRIQWLRPKMRSTG